MEKTLEPITLATLPEKSAQEVFDYVATHLLTQNERSILSYDDTEYFEDENIIGCMYRGENGLKCAAGCLMSDEEYKPEWEGIIWAELTTFKHVPNAHIFLIRALQEIHDQHPPKEWKRQLKLLAESRQLDSSVLNNF